MEDTFSSLGERQLPPPPPTPQQPEVIEIIEIGELNNFPAF
jgi:hypothetical protein